MQYGRSWNKSPSYAEFSSNNTYQESLKMAPFEMLYGRRCRTPLFCGEARERKVFWPDILQEPEKKVHIVRENLRVAQSRQKSYADQDIISAIIHNHYAKTCKTRVNPHKEIITR
jgi:hypothetical protein